MELLLGLVFGGVVIWALIRNHKEQQTYKRWEIASHRNASLAKDHGWFLSKDNKRLGLDNVLTKMVPLPPEVISLSEKDMSTELTIIFQQDGATITAHNSWCKPETLKTDCFKWMREFDIHDAKLIESHMLSAIISDLKNIGFVKCR
jgi:hypothetical protein